MLLGLDRFTCHPFFQCGDNSVKKSFCTPPSEPYCNSCELHGKANFGHGNREGLHRLKSTEFFHENIISKDLCKSHGQYLKFCWTKLKEFPCRNPHDEYVITIHFYTEFCVLSIF
ncbi:hypothetical protein KFK09_028231 [Dendrobium nobile]|uniref:Uncharacterized protein n=1 Tax=Dendrobium nobile TaxID=94219 RepID=A0A8T3A303_DENNO|nr:hypothetical protein KFK09_028231 [Dendrobium nobile]